MCILHTHLRRTVINAGGDGADGAWDVLSKVQNFLADVAVDCVVDLRNSKRMRSGIAVGKIRCECGDATYSVGDVGDLVAEMREESAVVVVGH